MIFNSHPKVRVSVAQTSESYDCATNESLLKGMLRLGRKGIPAGCVNGGCGVCKVRVLAGDIKMLGPISRAHVSLEEEAEGFTLACRAAPLTAVTVRVAKKLEKRITNGKPATAGK